MKKSEVKELNRVKNRLDHAIANNDEMMVKWLRRWLESLKETAQLDRHGQTITRHMEADIKAYIGQEDLADVSR